MADHRLAFHIEDAGGQRQRGEVVIVRAWRPDLEISSGAAFTIVLAREPLAADSPPPSAPNVVVCAPVSPVRLPAAVAEATVAYGTDDAQTAPLRLPRQALDAYASGTLLTAHPLSVRAQEIFHGDADEVRLDTLAQELLRVSRDTERYWHALDEVLSWPDPPAQLARPEHLRVRLRDTLQRAPSVQPGSLSAHAIDRLRHLADGAAPSAVAPSSGALAEDVALLRSLADRQREAKELIAMRAYLESARLHPDLRTLVVDHTATREQLSFVTLLSEPHRLGSMRAAFETFRAAYARAYLSHHQSYWQALARRHTSLEEAALTAQALSRLNTLPALGRPLGEEALAGYERLVQQRNSCPVTDLAASLREHPTCPACHITMEEQAPTDEARDVLRRLQAALARQQARLASEAVRRILARGGERLEQFLQIVQASDLTGLAQVLDDELLAFLRELLSEPVAPTPEALDLFEELARTYPVVSEEQVDAVLHTLRQLLIEQLASQRAADPSRPAAFRLASVPPPP